MQPKFAVGERVRIRQWDDMVEEYGERPGGDILPPGISCYFVSSMRDLCGKTFTITGSNPNYGKSFEYFFAENVGWHIAEYMLEPENPIDASGLIAAMCDMFE